MRSYLLLIMGFFLLIPLTLRADAQIYHHGLYLDPPLTILTLCLVLWTILLVMRRRLRLHTLRLATNNQQLQQQYKVLFEENKSMMMLIDSAVGQVVDANPAACGFYGYPREALVGMPLGRINTAPLPEIRAQLAQAFDGETHKFESVHRLADGSRRDVEVFSGPLLVAGRKLLCAVIHDISERRRCQAELTARSEFLQTIIDGVSDHIMVISTDYQLLMMNQVAVASLPEAELERSSFCCYELIHQRSGPCRGASYPCPLEEVKASGTRVTRIHCQRLEEETRTFEVTASPLWHEDGSLRGIIKTSRDITDRLKVEELLSENERRLRHMAHHDPLTGLPNRLLFEDRLRHALAQAQRNRHQLALMFIDLDRFKDINDSLGHEIGDKLLVEIGRRLTAVVREADTVARLGGDEFLVLLEQVDSFQTVTTMAQRIRHELGRMVEIGNHQLVATGSIGVSLFPDDAGAAEELIRCADVAMYHAKSEGKDNYQFYTRQLNARVHDMMVLEGDLRRALEEEQLCLYYQPQVDLKTGRLIGVEALLRWNHPRQGLVPPDDFIPLAEETGLIVALGEWVLREACRQQVRWTRQGFPGLRMAVNISGRQLKHRDFIETLDLILAESGIVPGDLELEITESSIMRDVQATIMDLTDLRVRGIRLSIDDFGTGYSSLSYLNRFPLDRLKIDRSFIGSLAGEQGPGMIVDAVIALGRSMDLEVIAEGVESQSQMDFLASCGCRFGQGFLFSRPLPEAELRQKFFSAPQSQDPLNPAGFYFNFTELDA